MINLSKGGAPVSLSKGATLKARVMWPPSTDYDLGAEVVYADGHSVSVAQFGAAGVPVLPATPDGTVKQLGDEVRSGAAMAEEVLEINLTADVVAVVPWAYSAQSNGTGSFRKYSVSMEVTDGVDTVRIDAKHASRDNTVYTCVPGIVTNFPGEGPRVHYREEYSVPGSEKRPVAYAQGGHVSIDFRNGPRNVYK